MSDFFKTDLLLDSDMKAASTGDLQTITGIENLKQALLHRLLTVPGTLVHRPTYGIGLPRYQNGLSSFVLQQKLAREIQDQFLEDPRVESVSAVGITSDDTNPQQVNIKILIKPVGYNEQEMIFTPFGGAAI
jgi:phage baseplate assembly protein W